LRKPGREREKERNIDKYTRDGTRQDKARQSKVRYDKTRTQKKGELDLKELRRWNWTGQHKTSPQTLTLYKRGKLHQIFT
jgi:hypothetical protein